MWLPAGASESTDDNLQLQRETAALTFSLKEAGEMLSM